MNLFQSAIQRQNQKRPPVWFMRQAGRYHSHYQGLRSKYSFIDLCKIPEVACEVTMGPIRDFGFDAAILFSDLLFPLEAMGMGLRYEEGPKLDWHLRSLEDLKRLGSGRGLIEQLFFQGRALELIRRHLPSEKGLLGFVGGPLTLFYYAVEGSHQRSLLQSEPQEVRCSALAGLKDGRWAGFFEKLCDLLIENMVLQAQSGADAVAVFDTCAGEVDPLTYREWIIPSLKILISEFKRRSPGTPVIYYSRGTGPEHWQSLKDKKVPIDCLAVDWRHDLVSVLSNWGKYWAIQGNIDPQWLFLEPLELTDRLRKVFESVRTLPLENRQGWICGLGHGVLPKTPEANVHLFLRLQKEMFSGGADADNPTVLATRTASVLGEIK